jgi:hypothetical protein
MNYELAEELKNAGFPQTDGEYIGSSGKECLIPKLGQLIDACGVERFWQLESRNISQGQWNASGYKKTRNRDEVTIVSGYGSTPEQAVANLWLALNK